MKLNAKISSERQSRIVSKSGDEYIHIELNAKNKIVGYIELYLFNDMEVDDEMTEDEYLIKFRRFDDEDWRIIRQGNL